MHSGGFEPARGRRRRNRFGVGKGRAPEARTVGQRLAIGRERRIDGASGDISVVDRLIVRMVAILMMWPEGIVLLLGWVVGRPRVGRHSNCCVCLLAAMVGVNYSVDSTAKDTLSRTGTEKSPSGRIKKSS